MALFAWWHSSLWAPSWRQHDKNIFPHLNLNTARWHFTTFGHSTYIDCNPHRKIIFIVKLNPFKHCFRIVTLRSFQCSNSRQYYTSTSVILCSCRFLSYGQTTGNWQVVWMGSVYQHPLQTCLSAWVLGLTFFSLYLYLQHQQLFLQKVY